MSILGLTVTLSTSTKKSYAVSCKLLGLDMKNVSFFIVFLSVFVLSVNLLITGVTALLNMFFKTVPYFLLNVQQAKHLQNRVQLGKEH